MCEIQKKKISHFAGSFKRLPISPFLFLLKFLSFTHLLLSFTHLSLLLRLLLSFTRLHSSLTYCFYPLPISLLLTASISEPALEIRARLARTNHQSKGWVSIDRSVEAALLSTTPRPRARSSTNNFTPFHCVGFISFGPTGAESAVPP